MLQSSIDVDDNLLQMLAKFNISYDQNTFKIGSTDVVALTEKETKDLVRIFTTKPEILRLNCIKEESNSVKFSLCAWFIGKTGISSNLASVIFDSNSKFCITESHLEDYAYICNYIKRYEPEALKSLSNDKLIHFYNHRIDSELRPLFIKLLLYFMENIPEEWAEILHLNWREGRRDLATSSLQTLLKLNPSSEFFNDLDQFERIEDIQVLTDVLLAAPTNNTGLFMIFRERIISIMASSEGILIKRLKTSHINRSVHSNWIQQWSRVIKTKKIWPAFETIHSIDLLSKLVLSDKSTFKSFYSVFDDADDEVKLSFLSDLIPEVLEQCTWLFSVLPRQLMNLFIQLLKATEPSKEILLSLCQLFMDCQLGTSSRKSFVNYLASHAEDEQIGEKCLGLIESFVERFPESRYVCLTLVKSLLDGVDTWDPRLLVPFYSSFSLMARTSDSVMNDLILLLKKQIYSSDPIYKRIGARGVGVFLSTNGSADRIKAREQSLLPDPDDTFNDMASCSQKPRESTPVRCDYHLRIIISLLEETVKSLRSDRQSMLIFLKYVNESFDSLDDELKDWIGDWTRSVFQSSFIVQIDEELFSYKYEHDQDNPLSLDFSSSELKECGPVLLSIMGRYEKYQNSGNLEGIDALQGCAIQIQRDASSSYIFQINFISLNYFRTILNVFQDDCRLEIVVKLQQELKDLIKSKPAFLAEFKIFPECNSLIQLTRKTEVETDDLQDLSVPEGSFLDELLCEAREPENRLSKTGSLDSKSQLYELNEFNFIKSLIPFDISFIEKLVTKNEFMHHDSIYKEIEQLIEIHYTNDIESQRRLLDCLLKISNDNISGVIDTISKFKRESFSNSQKQTLLRHCKEILKSTDEPILIQDVCKLLIDVLKCPEIISDPMNLIKISLNSSGNSTALKHLLALPKLDISSLISDIKNDQISLKNRLILLKGFGNRFSKELKHSNLGECQKILGIWAELIQFVRGSGIMKLLQAIVKESHVVLESFLSCDTLKRIECDASLLEGSSDRDSVLLLFKIVQQSTRGLQIICNHLKYASGNNSDLLAIPNLKRSLESVIFRVKELLTRSGCLSAFWMGNLKHRDLDGQEISSQVELLKLTESDSESGSEEHEGHESSNDPLDGNSNSDIIKLSESFIYDSGSDYEIDSL